ncbi:MAG: NAD-dependent epimerase/dehydratase family protein [Terriglobales bacterium]
MKLLIAGGAGYIGSVLIPKLLDRGYEIDVVDLFWFGNQLPSGPKIVHKDTFDLQIDDLRGYDQVLFLAGLSNDPMAEFSPSKNFIFNAAAPAYLAYIAKQAGVKRYVYASSCSVYGYTQGVLYDEDQPAVCGYPYGISKLQGEQAVLQLRTDEFSVISLRKGTVSGYSPRMRFDLIINAMFRSAMRDGVITVNNPAIWRPILGIQDAASAYIRAIEAAPEVSGIFNIASGNFTVGEVGDRVREVLERDLGRKIGLNIKHIQDFRNYQVSIDRARAVLSFHPRASLGAIVEDLLAHRGEIGDWDDPNYFNIQVLRRQEQPQAAAAGR